MHAGCAPVCGNLFHHAVERFLKVGLAQRRELSALERMRHKLKEKLWLSPRRAQPAPRLMLHVAADMEATLHPYGWWALNGFDSRFLHI